MLDIGEITVDSQTLQQEMKWQSLLANSNENAKTCDARLNQRCNGAQCGEMLRTPQL